MSGDGMIEIFSNEGGERSGGITSRSFDINAKPGTQPPQPTRERSDVDLADEITNEVFQAEDESDSDFIERTGRLPDPYRASDRVRAAIASSVRPGSTVEHAVERFIAQVRRVPSQSEYAAIQAAVTQADAPKSMYDGEHTPDEWNTYKFAPGHKLEAPEVIARNTSFTEEQISETMRDIGIATRHANVPQEVAQALVTMVGETYQDPPEGGFTIDGCLSAVRQVAGDETDKVVEAAQRFTQGKPALRAWLDASTLGSHPDVVLALATMQSRGITSKAAAEKHLAKVFNQPESPEAKRYFGKGGDSKLEQFVTKLAFAISSGGR